MSHRVIDIVLSLQTPSSSSTVKGGSQSRPKPKSGAISKKTPAGLVPNMDPIPMTKMPDGTLAPKGNYSSQALKTDIILLYHLISANIESCLNVPYT